MNRGYSYTPRGLARSPPRTDRLQAQDRSLGHKQPAKGDINIDDFGDMGSDEDDFMPPHGFLRDDDCIDDDYDGVPIDDVDVEGSPTKKPWERSPLKQEEMIRGDRITVLGSDNQRDSHPSSWPTTHAQEASRSRPGLGSSSSLMVNPIFTINSGSNRNISSLMGTNFNANKVQSFVRSNDGSNPFLKTAKMPAPSNSMGFIRSADDSDPFIKASKQSFSETGTRFVPAKDISSSTFQSHGSRLSLSGTCTSFLPTKDSSSSNSSSGIRPPKTTPDWSDKRAPAQSSSAAWSNQGPGLSESSKGQIQLDHHPSLTSTGAANTSQLQFLQQAAVLQQALTGLTQLDSQSGLNLLGAQNLLLQASQNPALAAALFASGGLLNPGLSSTQRNASNNPAVQGLLKSTTTVTAAASPDTPQTSVGLLSYPLRTNIKPSSGSIPQKKAIPDGSGSARYPAPDVTSLVFDPSTGYRFDSSTGLHYDANSGYFFNSELKIFLRWDKFTQTYLKVDNPPPVPRLLESSPVSFVKEPSPALHDRRPLSSSFAGPLLNDSMQSSSFAGPLLKDSMHSSSFAGPLLKGSMQSSSFSGPLLKDSMQSSSFAGPLLKDSMQSATASFAKDTLLGYPPVRGVPTSSSRDIITAQSPVVAIPTDFSKPPPPLPQTSYSQAGFQSSLAKPPSIMEQKVATLPNYAETSLFNKLRKAKLAQTAQAKPERKQWGSPDPLLEAAQKHTAEITKPQVDVLNLNEILQRSRQFMKQKIGSEARGEPTARDTRKIRSRSRSGDRRPSRRSRSQEKLVNRRGRPSLSPQRRLPARSPESRLRGTDKSPTGRIRRKPSLSPPSNRGKLSSSPRRKKSISRGRSPINRAHAKASHSPEARKRRHGSREAIPPRRRLRSSKSPNTRQGMPISRGKSPEKRTRGRRSVSPDSRRMHPRSRTPVRNLQRSPPKVKVVLNQSPGGSKMRVRSPLRGHKRSAERCPSGERRTVKRRLSCSPERKSLTRDDPTRRPLRERTRGNKSSEKDKISDLIPLSHETPPDSGKNASRKEKNVSGYKSLSNLRNQGKDKPQRDKAKITTSKPSIEVDLTFDSDNEKAAPSKPLTGANQAVDSDDEQHARANLRLVNERFSSGWESRKPKAPGFQKSTKKTDSIEDSNPSAEDAKVIHESKDTKGKVSTMEEAELLEDSTEFDFLNDTLDDDKESTVVDEYEEILDYQDLEEPAEMEAKEPNSTQIKSDKESVESPAINIVIDPDESVQTSTSESHVDRKQGLTDGSKVCNIDAVPATRPSNDSASAVELKSPIAPELVIKESSPHRSHGIPIDIQLEANREGDDPKIICGRPTGIKEAPSDEVDVPESSSHDLGGRPESLNNEEWNVVDSVGEHEESQQTIATDVKELSHDHISKPVLAEADMSSSTSNTETIDKTQKATNANSDVPPMSIVPRSRDDLQVNTGPAHLQISKDGAKNDPGVGEGTRGGDKVDIQLPKVDENDDEFAPQGRVIDGPVKETISHPENEEPLSVRSVSDIEKFLLLSSQEVEAKREQGVDSSDKKSGVFSRLGDKLQSDRAGEPEAVVESEPSVPSTTPTKKVVVPSKGRTVVAKPSTTASVGNKLKLETEDPIGKLFDDKPRSTVLIGPLNFIEPLKGFQHFTQLFVKKQLQEEGVKFRQVYVSHEDVTGAPFHYILVLFQNAKLASAWYKKRNGKFKCDEKLFSQVPGHTKQKLIRGVESSMYYTEGNWVCNVCKKGNFPPRSLCFGCFQHRDPDGFSPVTILDKGKPNLKKSNYVGTPKLKFFVTKETIIESAPPLDGFDILSIEMIMDEEMGLPAGICVFELNNFIDAGKLKKYFNNRDVEAVSVELHERPKPKSTKEPVRNDPKVARGGLQKPSQERSLSEIETPGLTGTRELSPPLTSKEVSLRSPGLPKRCSDSSSCEVPVRERSPTPSREVRVRRHSPTPREVRVRCRSPTPPRAVRVRGRSPTPPRSVRVPVGRSPSPPRPVRDARGKPPSPLRRRLSRDRVGGSHSPRLCSPGYQPRDRSPPHVSEDAYPTTGDRTARALSGGHTARGVSPRYGSREQPAGYRSPVSRRSPFPRQLPSFVPCRSPVRRQSPIPRRSPVPCRSPFRHQSPIPRRSPFPRRSPVRRLSPFPRRSSVPRRSPGYRSPPRYSSRSPIRDVPRRPSPSPRYRSRSPPARPIKPDGRSTWIYPPPDPTNFRFEPRSGLDYDPTTTLYYEPKSCCFYNDDTNEWLEYEPRTGRYVLVR